MIRLYLAPRYSAKPDIRLVRSRLGAKEAESLLFKAGGAPRADIVFTSAVADADFVLLPQPVRKLSVDVLRHIENAATFARSHGKRLLVVVGTDRADRMHLDIENVIALTGSAYRHSMRGNEIVSVPFVQDLLQDSAIQTRPKGERPVVGFCGYAGFPNIVTHARYLMKNALLDAAALVNPRSVLEKRGVYYRRLSMRALKRDSRVQTNFIVRESFSGNAGLISGDAAKARDEYIANMASSDFILAPKGDGNYSQRFYEALSMGRIPVLIDTDMRLPLEAEGIVDYSKFIVRVPYTDIDRAGEYTMRFWESHDDASYGAAQQAARTAFTGYLEYEAFWSAILTYLKERE